MFQVLIFRVYPWDSAINDPRIAKTGDTNGRLDFKRFVIITKKLGNN